MTQHDAIGLAGLAFFFQLFGSLPYNQICDKLYAISDTKKREESGGKYSVCRLEEF